MLVEWEGWANSSESSALLEAEIQALKAPMLTCAGGLPAAEGAQLADQDRANQDWLPRALAAGLKRFAVVVPSSVLAEVNIKDSLGKVPAHALDVAYFETTEQARSS